MSFDITVGTGACAHCGSGGTTIQDLNITHNLNDMVEAILSEAGAPEGKQDSGYKTRSWGRLHGWQCAEVLDVLRRASAIAHDASREAKLRAGDPSNGWGTLDNVRWVLTKLLEATSANPKAFIEVRG